MDNDSRAELLIAIRQGVDMAIAAIDDIEAELLDGSKRLRTDPSKETVAALSAGIGNFDDLVSLMREIHKGCTHLRNPSVSSESKTVLTKSADLFHTMQESMERKDWIVLANLIQRELSPILGESRRECFAVRDCLAQG